MWMKKFNILYINLKKSYINFLQKFNSMHKYLFNALVRLKITIIEQICLHIK